MIGYDHTLVGLTSNVFVYCTNVKIYLYKYAQWMELSMYIHEENEKASSTQHGKI